MLLVLDDPQFGLFNVGDAAALDGARVTLSDPDGTVYGTALVRMLSPTTLRLEERETLPPEERYTFRSHGAPRGMAVRTREVETRPEQAAFRARVGALWGWKCAITGEAVPEALEAAHLPGASWRAGDNAATDGILLRADLHRLLDAGLLKIEGGAVSVKVGTYQAFDGLVLSLPDAPTSLPCCGR